MKCLIIAGLTTVIVSSANAQDAAPRPITMEEYDKAKTYLVKDLDKDTYVKPAADYILDRYEMRKPYFITGDDGLKKRIDLYKLIAKNGMQELGTQIFYTNEKGKVFTAIQPNFNADAKVWEKYFEDIHAIDKVEKNFVLKLSYILSKEMSFQLYKSMNHGKDLGAESGTYGTDICFPGTQAVSMADGSVKMLSDIKAGDQVITVDPVTKQAQSVSVSKLVSHEAKNYAITTLLVVNAEEQVAADAVNVRLQTRLIQATPNHPVMTGVSARKSIGDVNIGETIVCSDAKGYLNYTVMNKIEKAGGVQKVYNMELSGGTTAVLNEVMVLQK
ncbi:MAG: hypothetical protein ABW174_13090 [Flavitalea sp.]